jgi:multidrug transporter EmrE-like cation transporter
VKDYLLILPVALMVACSQILIKLRSNGVTPAAEGLPARLLQFVSDPVVLAAYGAALLASFAWLYVVSKLPLTIAFPIYIGLTFLLVVLGSWWFLGEAPSAQKTLAMLLVLAGIALGLAADA